MKNFLDKAVVMLFSILLILNAFQEGSRIILIFLTVTVASFMSFLRMLGEKGILANKIITLVLGVCTIVWPDMIVWTPMLAYEIFLDRHFVAGLVLIAGVVRFYTGESVSWGMVTQSMGEGNTGTYLSKVYVGIYILLQTGLAVYLSYRTEKLLKFEKENRKIRDEGEIKKETLKKQNRNLMEEQDKSISAAQLAERNRIAREIHDNVGHMLSRSILQVGAMMVVHKESPIADELKSLRETLDTAMNNIRSSVHDIRDEAIKLDMALEEIAEPLKGKYKVSFEFDADAENISKEIKYATINIVKEAVSNIIKYSVNECVDIRFYEHPSMYQIIIHDYSVNSDINQRDDSLIDSGKLEENRSRGLVKQDSRKSVHENNRNVFGEGMGLENIRLRAEKLGGNVTVTRGNGFRIFARIPKNEV